MIYLAFYLYISGALTLIALSDDADRTLTGRLCIALWPAAVPVVIVRGIIRAGRGRA